MKVYRTNENPSRIVLSDATFEPMWLSQTYPKQTILHEEDEEVVAFSYYDGNQWRTVVLRCEGYEPDLFEVDETEAREILAAYEAAEYDHEWCGFRYYKSGESCFVESSYQNDWWTAMLLEEEF